MVRKAKEVEKEISAEELTDEVVVEKTDKEMTEDWEVYVRSEVEAILTNILPNSVTGGIGISYKHKVIEDTEAGPVFDETKAIGVDIVLSFDFVKEIDKPM